MRLNKYWHVLNIGIQNTLIYRVNFLVRAVFGLVPLTATLFLWRKVFEGKGEGGMVGAYALEQMVSYYLLVTVVDALTAVNEDDWQIAGEIREGTISQFLLKPMDYMAYRLCLFGTGRLVYTLVALVPVGLFILVQREFFVWPKDGVTLGLFGLSVAMTALLQFFISYTMALLSFWILEVSTFIFIVFAFEYLAGGHVFPLDILPPLALKLLYLTPFPYQMFFPVSVYLGRVKGSELWFGLAVQAGWVAGCFLVARFVWQRGIRKYAAFGG